MVASHKPVGRKASLIQIVSRRFSNSKQKPAKLGEEEMDLGEDSEGQRKQSLVHILSRKFSRTPRSVDENEQLGEENDKPPTERRESLVKKISRRFSRSKPRPLSEEDVEYVMAHTGLAREAVELHYRKFLRSHPAGVMDPAGLRAMLQESLPGADTARLADHIWRIYDTNLDGEVDFREFMLALCVMRTGSAEANLRQIFRLFDINSDGKVERGELGSVVEELSKLGQVEEETVQQAFMEMDANMDGGVTQDEFVQACLQQKGASTSLALRVIDIFVAG